VGCLRAYFVEKEVIGDEVNILRSIVLGLNVVSRRHKDKEPNLDLAQFDNLKALSFMSFMVSDRSLITASGIVGLKRYDSQMELIYPQVAHQLTSWTKDNTIHAAWTHGMCPYKLGISEAVENRHKCIAYLGETITQLVERPP
jgi:hypothetical protein